MIIKSFEISALKRLFTIPISDFPRLNRIGPTIFYYLNVLGEEIYILQFLAYNPSHMYLALVVIPKVH